MEHEESIETSPVVPPQHPVKKSQHLVKKSHLNKWYVIAAVLIGVIVVQGFLYLSLSLKYNTLDANQKSLTSEYNNLTSDYDTLTNRYAALQSEHSTLQGNYGSLQTNYNSLQSNYSSLQTFHSSLQTEYDSLQSNYESYVSSYSNLRKQVNNRTFGINGKYFITPQDPTVDNLVIQITGGWSDQSDWNERWTDTKLMYDWVVNNIQYRDDGLSPILPSTPSGNLEYGQEMWQLPSETLNLKKGDCEDMAILLTSMIRNYYVEKYQCECIGIKGSDSGHMGVQILVEGGKLTILDPAGKYYTQTANCSIDVKDVSTEINNWLNYYIPHMGNDVHVVRVFSDVVDRLFSSTIDYTSWMYSR